MSKVTPPKCPICGRFMGRIGLIARVRLEIECNIKLTHMCKLEEITYATSERTHKTVVKGEQPISK